VYDTCTKAWQIAGNASSLVVYDITINTAQVYLSGSQGSGDTVWAMRVYGEFVISDYSLAVGYNSQDGIVQVRIFIYQYIFIIINILTTKQGNFSYGSSSSLVTLQVQLAYQEVDCSSATPVPAFSGVGLLTLQTGALDAFSTTTFDGITATYNKCNETWNITAVAPAAQTWDVAGLAMHNLAADFSLSPVSSAPAIVDGESSETVFYGHVSAIVQQSGLDLGITVDFDNIIGIEALTLHFAYADSFVNAHADLYYNRTCNDGVRTTGNGSLVLSGIANADLGLVIDVIYYGDCTTGLVWTVSGSTTANVGICCYFIHFFFLFSILFSLMCWRYIRPPIGFRNRLVSYKLWNLYFRFIANVSQFTNLNELFLNSLTEMYHSWV
jgi:hypothetical protein